MDEFEGLVRERIIDAFTCKRCDILLLWFHLNDGRCPICGWLPDEAGPSLPSPELKGILR